MKKIKVEGTELTAHVTLGKDAEGGYGLEVRMEVSIGGVERSVAEELVQAAHRVCPYSKATRGNIDVELVVV